jgi:hypothetical protein
MKKHNIVYCIYLAMLLLLNSPVCAYAKSNELRGNKKSGTSEVDLSMEAAEFNISIIYSTPIVIEKKGKLYILLGAEIINNSYGPIVISKIKFHSKNGLAISSLVKEIITNIKEKDFKIKVDNGNASKDKSVSLDHFNWPIIPGHSNMTVLCYIECSKQQLLKNYSNIFDTEFILDWYE